MTPMERKKIKTSWEKKTPVMKSTTPNPTGTIDPPDEDPEEELFREAYETGVIKARSPLDNRFRRAHPAGSPQHKEYMETPEELNMAYKIKWCVKKMESGEVSARDHEHISDKPRVAGANVHVRWPGHVVWRVDMGTRNRGRKKHSREMLPARRPLLRNG